MKMNQNRQYQQDLEAQASLHALKNGIKQDLMISSYFSSDKPLSKREKKLQDKMERMLEAGYQKELADREKRRKLRAEAVRQAFKRGLMLGIKTE